MARMQRAPRHADRVFVGDVVTMDPERPTAQAVAIADGRIADVGDRADLAAHVGPGTVVTELGRAALLPGFVEAHGHLTTEAVVLGPTIVDIRPVTIATADAVVERIRAEVARSGADGVHCNGWDPLLQVGLPTPTRAWLDALSPAAPLAILHNSGHSAYFNTAAAHAAGLTRDTPDPLGASFGRDEHGELDGSAREMGAVLRVFGHLLQVDDVAYASLVAAATARLNRAGITTAGDLSYDPAAAARIDAARAAGALTTRLRLYEMSSATLATSPHAPLEDALVRRVGVKLWADGSPWVGNVATSFPYLDTPATRSIGLPPHHTGAANYTGEQVLAISRAYMAQGWQLACHVHGDAAIDMGLDAWERLRAETGAAGDARRHRLEHVGAMTPAQFARAHRLGVTASLFVDHLYYWGDTLVDDLFGEPRGSHWVAARSALDAGLRISFHNDGTVTPAEPLRNVEVAATRRTRSGRVLAPEERISVAEALRAQTIDSAYQLHSEHEVGSITPGKLADLVVLDRNPTHVDLDREPAGTLASIRVLETILGGATVHAADGSDAPPLR